MDIPAIIEGVLKREGGYVDHPNDRGGPTMYGITQAVAAASGYSGPMQSLPIDLARQIYTKRYVSEPLFDKVAAINQRIGEELIDTGVNMGPSRAAEFLQRWLNAFNYAGSPSGYGDLFVDGRLGQQSLNALQAFLMWRGVAGANALLKGLNCIQGSRYLEITERDKSQRAFTMGWITDRVVV